MDLKKDSYTANLFDSNSIKQIDVNVKLNKHLKLSIQHEAFNFTVMIIYIIALIQRLLVNDIFVLRLFLNLKVMG